MPGQIIELSKLSKLSKLGKLSKLAKLGVCLDSQFWPGIQSIFERELLKILTFAAEAIFKDENAVIDVKLRRGVRELKIMDDVKLRSGFLCIANNYISLYK